MLFFIYLFRFKYIDISTLKDNEFYSPVSGTISSIDTDGYKKTVTIDVGIFDPHIVRSLDNSKIKVIKKRGLNLPLGTYKSSKLNEQLIIKYNLVSMKLLSSLFNPSLKIDEKNSFKKGEKIGMFFHGKVIVNLDESLEIKVNLKEKVITGKSIIATFKENK